MAKIDGYKLKPCPFCGTEILAIERIEESIYVFVACQNMDCLAYGPLDLGQSGAIERWNDRAQEAA